MGSQHARAASASTQEKDLVWLRYLHTHSLKLVLHDKQIFIVVTIVALVVNQQLSAVV